jgi:uncharacterized membrane protein
VHFNSQRLEKHVFETIIFLSLDFCFSEHFFRRNMYRSAGTNEMSDIKSIISVS